MSVSQSHLASLCADLLPLQDFKVHGGRSHDASVIAIRDINVVRAAASAYYQPTTDLSHQPARPPT